LQSVADLELRLLEQAMNASVETSETILAPEIRRLRRVVTGHNSQGASVILSDDVSGHVTPFMSMANFAVTDFWRAQTPADNSEATRGDPCGAPFEVAPPVGGSVFRVTQFPPEKDWLQPGDAAADAPSAPRGDVDAGGRHPHMHRTRTLDYAVVLSGEIWAVMDVGEARLVAGDVLIQRGTNHAWANRSDSPCIVAFVMLDAHP
jgi:hypothetical protein